MEPKKSIRNVDNSSGRRKNDTDRISALPDCILGVILSSIPTKNAVATSTLSKRWQFLWRMVHNLDFCHQDEGLDIVRDKDENKKFVRYVNHVLLHHDAGVLNKFRLVWRNNCIKSHLIPWIKIAVTRNVHDLSLTLRFRKGIDMPVSVFSCESLRSLRLAGWWICLSAPTVVCLPRLEVLRLDGLTFGSGKDLENFIKGCPMLNYLHVDVDGMYEHFRFVISSTSLKRLFLSLGEYMSVELDASSLEHLELHNNESVNFRQKNLSSVVEAVLGINFTYTRDSAPVGLFNSIVDTLSALSCAKILSLSDDVMMALGLATIKLSTDFKRLVELETNVFGNRWSSLLDLIQRSDNLEILTVYKGQGFLVDEVNDEDHSHSSWTTPVEVPRCLSTSLKKVVLNGYFGFEDEREMLRYMLNNGSALEVVDISFGIYMKGSMFEQVEEICEYPRMSAMCEMKFSGWTSKGKEKVCCTVPPGTFPNISFVAMKSSH